MKTPLPAAALRGNLNPDHHIWNNNGTWWCHFTVHHPDYTKERVRVSLGTKDREEARRRRDFILRGTDAIVRRLPVGAMRPAPCNTASRDSCPVVHPPHCSRA